MQLGINAPNTSVLIYIQNIDLQKMADAVFSVQLFWLSRFVMHWVLIHERPMHQTTLNINEMESLSFSLIMFNIAHIHVTLSPRFYNKAQFKTSYI